MRVAYPSSTMFAGLALICSTTAYSQPLEGYTALSFPRSSLRLGAKWLQGTGPNGPATAADNIDHSEGLSSTVISNEVKRNITFSLGTFLGLSGNKARNLNTTYTNLTIDRVADVSKVAGLSSGQRILYEAIKAGTIEIVSASGDAATLQASAQAKGIPVTVSAGGGNSRKLTMSGKDLYLAYRVMEIGPATRTTSRGAFSRLSTGLEAEVGPYRVTLDTESSNTNFCANSFSPARVSATILNTQQPDITGSFPSTVVEVRSHSGGQDFPLPSTQTNNNFTANRMRISYYPTGRSGNANGQSACFLDYPPATNFAELTSSTFTLRPFRFPTGL